jgi:hypothetical protein
VNDLELLRDLRAGVPSPAPERLAAGRARLVDSIARARAPRPQPRRGRSRAGRARRVLLPAGLSLATAAILAVVLGAPPAAAPTATAPNATVPTATVPTGPAHPVGAVQMLDAAAVTVLRQPAGRPADSQWIYTKFVEYEYGQGTVSSDNWITFDGSRSAYLDNGRLTVHTQQSAQSAAAAGPFDRYNANATPATAYDALAALPANPDTALAEVDKQLAALGPSILPGPASFYAPANLGQKQFDYLSQLLWNASGGAPATAEAAVFHAMAAIPGISIQTNVADVVGRPALGVSANDGETELLLDPRTYQVLGMRVVSDDLSPGGSGAWPAKGAVIASMAWAQVSLVSAPGRT